ncbi:MAG: polymerase [Abditibacteriota bacterium]|nr:polymerase [Abditibacteriota bacterium]
MRTIIHVDLDAFFCAIEEQRDPSLHGKAFAVGAQPNQRGVVASCSYPARHHGVRSAMAMARALSLCPQLIIVPSRHAAYRAASAQVMALLHSVTPQVEQISIDEAFLDVSALLPEDAEPEAAYRLAQHCQQRIKRELQLSCSVGVASNKMVAKIATDYGKANAGKKNSPQAICVVPPGEEAAFLAPLPTSALWGVGPKTEAALARLGLNTIGDLARHPPEDLLRRFGQHGYDLSQHARGIDKRPIVTFREVKSVSSETTFVHDVTDWDQLHDTLRELVDDVVHRLQRHQLQGSTVKLKLRWPDFTTPTRQMTLPAPTDETGALLGAATSILQQLWIEGTPVRLLGVGVTGLSSREQLSLWDAPKKAEEHAKTPAREAASSDAPPASEPAVADSPEWQKHQEKQQKLQHVLELLHKRFGPSLVQRGCRNKTIHIERFDND